MSCSVLTHLRRTAWLDPEAPTRRSGYMLESRSTPPEREKPKLLDKDMMIMAVVLIITFLTLTVVLIITFLQ